MASGIPLQHTDHPLDIEALPLLSRHRFAYRVTTMADGTTLALPVMVMRGGKAGPRLACVAGVHGNEHEGITALLELWEELDLAGIAGTLMMAPVGNPPAFHKASRRNPEDMLDMNRSFPGRIDGSVTEQLAYHLYHGIVQGADMLLSMHGWTDDSLVVPYTEYPRESPVSQASLAAARSFGLEYLEAFDWPPGLLVAVASRAGIPSIEPEIGGQGVTLPERRARYKLGVRNLMKHLGMLPGSPETPEPIRHVERAMLYAPAGGIIRRCAELGDGIQEQGMVAVITDLTGEPLAEIRSPLEGFVASLRLRASVNPGDLIATIFRPLTD